MVQSPTFQANEAESNAIVTHISMQRFNKMYFMSYLHDMGRSCTQSTNVPSCQKLNMEVLSAITERGFDGKIDEPLSLSVYKANADSN